MNWDFLIYGGMAAAAAGLTTALIVFRELRIPEVIAYLSGRTQRREVGRIRESRSQSAREGGSQCAEEEGFQSAEEEGLQSAEEERLRSTEEGRFTIKRRILVAWDGEAEPATKTKPLKGRPYEENE